MANVDDPDVYYVQEGPPAVVGVQSDADDDSASVTSEALGGWVSRLARSLADADVLILSVATGASIADGDAEQSNSHQAPRSKVELRVQWNKCGGKLVGPGTGVQEFVFYRSGAGPAAVAEE